MDYNLEGPKWGGAGLGTSGGVVTWAVDGTVSGSFASYIASAFADWAHYANISFQQVASTASAQIDFTFGFIDGLNGVLGNASYSFYPGQLISSQVTFDSAENWHIAGNKIVSDGGANFFIVALHEIGHSLGLDHYTGGLAVMNPSISPALSDLTPSDIHGIQALYGPLFTSNLFGEVTHDINSNGGKIFALYDALFDRQPDVLGLEHLVYSLERSNLTNIANAFINSPEGQTHLAAATNTEFVQKLYETALHRVGDAGGIRDWVNALDHGMSKADVAIAFALSGENISGMQSALNAGIFVPDQNASDIARLYYGILGRAPDANGLEGWTKVLDSGASLKSVTQSFLSSSEYTTAHGNESNTQFLNGLYEDALGRQPDPSGLDAWLNALSQGTSRTDVALAFAESTEAQIHLLPVIESGWVLA